jgi:hypothetical protein
VGDGSSRAVLLLDVARSPERAVGADRQHGHGAGPAEVAADQEAAIRGDIRVDGLRSTARRSRQHRHSARVVDRQSRGRPVRSGVDGVEDRQSRMRDDKGRRWNIERSADCFQGAIGILGED